MSTTIPIDHFRSALFLLFEETFEKVSGIYLDGGTSIAETLAGISAETASTPVSDCCASIAAQVYHTRFYLDLLNRVAQTGEFEKTDWDATWTTVTTVTDDEWDALRAGIIDSYHSLKVTLSNDAPFQHEAAVAGAMGIVAHTAYHLGEIRQALCTVGR